VKQYSRHEAKTSPAANIETFGSRYLHLSNVWKRRTYKASA